MQSDAAMLQRALVVADILGVGGNSIVYRAHDPRHGRDVAVKVLRSDAISEAADARLLRVPRAGKTGNGSAGLVHGQLAAGAAVSLTAAD